MPLTVFRTGVDANDNPAKQSIAEIVANIDVFEHGIRRGASSLLLTEHTILSIGRQTLCVRGVWRCCLDIVDEILVKEELTNVGDGATCQGSIGKFCCVLMDDDVLI